MQQVVPKCSGFTISHRVCGWESQEGQAGWLWLGTLMWSRLHGGQARSSASSFTHTSGPWAGSLEPWGWSCGGFGASCLHGTSPHSVSSTGLLRSRLPSRPLETQRHVSSEGHTSCPLAPLPWTPPTSLPPHFIFEAASMSCPASREGHPDLHPFWEKGK